MGKKYHIVLDTNERRLIINCLNNLRNQLIQDGKYTDIVDDVLIKLTTAKQKKFKISYKEA